MGEALTFKFWIVILVTSKLHSRWRFYNGLCVAAQKYVDFTAVSGSELLAGNNNFTVFTISNENTEKRHIFILKNNSHVLFSYLDKKSIYFLDEWKNLPVDMLLDIYLKLYLLEVTMMEHVCCFINKSQWEFDDRISIQLHGTS